MFTVLFNVYFTVLCVFTVWYSVYCTLYSVYCTLYSAYCTLYSAYCTLYSAYCTFYSVYCILYSVYCTFYSVYCTIFQDLLINSNNIMFSKFAKECKLFIYISRGVYRESVSMGDWAHPPGKVKMMWYYSAHTHTHPSLPLDKILYSPWSIENMPNYSI